MIPAKDVGVFMNRSKIFGTTVPEHRYLTHPLTVLQNLARTVALYSSATSERMCEVVRHEANELGWSVVFNETIADANDMGPLVTRMKATNPDMVMACVTGTESVEFLVEAKKQDFSPNIFVTANCVPTTMYETALRRVGLTLRDGDFVLCSSSDKVGDSLATEADKETARSWASMSVVVQAIENTSSLDLDDVAGAISTQIFPTVFGELSFDTVGMNNMELMLQQYHVDGPKPIPMASAESLNLRSYVKFPSWNDRDCYIEKNRILVIGIDEQGKCQKCSSNQISTYNTTKRIRLCEDCSSSQVAVESELGGRECKSKCGRGMYATDRGTCEKCQPGKYQVQGMPVCELCPGGRFSKQSGATTCNFCEAGYFANSRGASTCDECEPGRVISTRGGTECYPCTVGKFQNEKGQKRCTLCAPGRKAPNESSDECEACRPGTHSDWGSRTCLPCESGKYMDMSSGASECKVAPPGTFAPESGMERPWNKEGNYATKNNETWSWIKCKHDLAACRENETCNVGHTGTECFSCLPNYVRTTTCTRCPPMIVNVIFSILVLTAMAALAILLTFFIARAPSRNKDLYPVVFKLAINHLIFMSFDARIFDGIITMLAETQVADSKSVREIESLRVWTRWLHIFDGSIGTETDVFSPTCLTIPAWYNQQTMDDFKKLQTNHTGYFLEPNRQQYVNFQWANELIRLILWFHWPLILCLIACVCGYCKLHRHLRSDALAHQHALDFYRNVYMTCFHSAKRGMQSKTWCNYVELYTQRVFNVWWPVSHARSFKATGRIEFKSFIYECLPIFLAVSFLTYVSTLRGLLRPLHCVSLGHQTTQFVLWDQGVVECSVLDVLFWLACIFSLVWLVGLPTYVLWMFFRLKTEENRHARRNLTRRFGIIFQGYQEKRWWWETVVFIRKGVLVLLEVLPFPGSMRVFLFLILALVFTTLDHICDPYDKRGGRILPRLERLQLGLWVFSAVCGKILSRRKEVDTTCYLLIGLTTISNWSFALWLVGLLASEAVKHVLKFEKGVQELDSSEAQKPVDAEMPNLFEKANAKLLSFFDPSARKKPYICMDTDFGWVTVCGSGADLAQPTYIPRGDDCGAQSLPAFRPVLSEAPFTPTPLTDTEEITVTVATEEQRSEVMGMILDTVSSVCMQAKKPAFSASVLEFVLRAAFVLQARKHEENTASDAGREVSVRCRGAADKSGNPLWLQHESVGGDLEADDPENQEPQIGGHDTEDDGGSEMYLIQGKDMDDDLKANCGVVSQVWSARKLNLSLPHTTIAHDAVANMAQASHMATSKVADAFERVGVKSALGNIAAAAQTSDAVMSSMHATRDAAALAKTSTQQLTKVAKSVTASAAHVVDDAMRSTRSGLMHAGGGSQSRTETPEVDVQVEAPNEQEVEDEDEKAEIAREMAEKNEIEYEKRLTSQYTGMVSEMFEGRFFRRGMEFAELESSLMQVATCAGKELTIWLDLFEEKLIFHRATADRAIKKPLFQSRDEGPDEPLVCEWESEQTLHPNHPLKPKASTEGEPSNLTLTISQHPLPSFEIGENDLPKPIILSWLRFFQGARVLGAHPMCARASDIRMGLQRANDRAKSDEVTMSATLEELAARRKKAHAERDAAEKEMHDITQARFAHIKRGAKESTDVHEPSLLGKRIESHW
eukprot:TRINITY_DN34080_c0_g1_i1.p1 TRINITY_DN34080_c0_g1~~TRINITY_DN34080_c0_g1_i1.p1  ORF type:complete len:1817 (-),score=231.08 TRINITY_DN34080_c0_g1_i1:22-4989(-)